MTAFGYDVHAGTADDQTNEIDSALVTVANFIGFGCR